MKVQYASQLIAQGICLLSEGLTDPSCVLSEKFNLRPITARLYSTSVGSRLEDFMWPSHSNGVKCTRQSVRPSVSRINPCELLWMKNRLQRPIYKRVYTNVRYKCGSGGHGPYFLFHLARAGPGRNAPFIMATLRSTRGHYSFALWFLLSSFFCVFSSPNISRRRLDFCHNCLSANLGCRSEMCCTRLAEIQDVKKSPKSPYGRHCTTLSGYISASDSFYDFGAI